MLNFVISIFAIVTIGQLEVKAQPPPPPPPPGIFDRNPFGLPPPPPLAGAIALPPPPPPAGCHDETAGTYIGLNLTLHYLC